MPGLALELAPTKTPQGVIDRLTGALDLEAGTGTATFSVQWHDAISNWDAHEPAATIQRADGADARPMVDVFVDEWATKFKDDWEAQNLFMRAFRTILGLFGLRWSRAIGAIPTPGNDS